MLYLYIDFPTPHYCLSRDLYPLLAPFVPPESATKPISGTGNFLDADGGESVPPLSRSAILTALWGYIKVNLLCSQGWFMSHLYT